MTHGLGDMPSKGQYSRNHGPARQGHGFGTSPVGNTHGWGNSPLQYTHGLGSHFN